jgi:hypothetical protein
MGSIRSLLTSARGVTRTPRGGQPESSSSELGAGSRSVLDNRDGERLIARRARSGLKLLARSVLPAPRDRRSIVLIFGCQRSGTTMLQQTLLDRSWRVVILEEHDRRLVGDGDPEETEWEEDSIVFGRIRRLPFEVVAVKPLVESDRASELIETAGKARGIWMLRHYLDVSQSNLRRFGVGNAHRDLYPFLLGDTLDWRCRGASEETRDTVVELLKDGLEPLDAAALFWWTRNKLYFDQHLSENERVRVLRYERTRSNPEEVIRALSSYIGISLPIHAIVHRVRTQTATQVGDLNPTVEALCTKMWESFEGCPEL